MLNPSGKANELIWSHRRLRVLLWLLAIAQFSTAAAPDLQQLRNGVVGVEVGRENSNASKGTGFVVSVEGDTVSVLTARHLFVEGRDRFPGPVSVTFYLDRLTPYPAAQVTESPFMDLLLLRVKNVPDDITSKLPAYAVRPADEPLRLTERLHVFGGKSQDWQVAAGEISDVGDGDSTDKFRFDGKGTRAGFSGALITDSDFRLVGIHLGATDNEEAFGRAVRVGTAYEVLTQRLGVRVLNKLAAGTAPPAILTAARSTNPVAGDLRKNSKDGLTYVWIPPGGFQMGCSPGDGECYSDEKPPHRVTISKGFWLSQTPTTQAAYAQAMSGASPSRFKGPQLPVEQVSWDDAKAYCEAVGGRLPTEAEWEYAARGGNQAARYGELDKIAWYGANSGTTTHPVGTKEPNGWKLYDMLGNVWQWTADWYGEEYYSGNRNWMDPQGPANGTLRTLRGGSWNVNPGLVRVSVRLRLEPGDRNDLIGARCVGESVP